MNTNRVPNQLIDEKSPYLLQHAYNPVNWYPWGKEAFEKAKGEDKPIFLSIGYSTCHWCHVMAHESFEDEEAAAALNRDFIAVKVDREERPDVDAVYMTVCQALTGSGGWPLTVFMTPDQVPFYACTYLPKESRYSMPGLMDVLFTISEQWKHNRGELLRSGNEIARAVSSQAGQTDQRKSSSFKGLVQTGYQQLVRSFDPRFGGFGRSPKFPTPHNLMFLLRYYQSEKENFALDMAEKTLRQMARGGIYDSVGFGFSRYSTDEKWLVPHFEKMLYDNALLVMAYLETYQITGDAFYRTTAEHALEYVLREMTDPEGGFYCAQDADSDGEEGKYYVFTPEEILHLLGKSDGEYFNSYFGITEYGNFKGKNVPNLLKNESYDIPDERIERLIRKVYKYRLLRTSLHKDDKILTSWNSLMIASLSKAYQILGNDCYLTAARKTMRLIWEQLGGKDGALKVRRRDGESSGQGNLDDYAFTVWALLELYGADYQTEDLERALMLNQQLIAGFRDEEGGGFYMTQSGAEPLLFRPKETYDGAIPSGNSVAGWCLLRLAALTGSPELEKAAFRQIEFLRQEAQDYPSGHSFALMALMAAETSGVQLVAVMNDEEDLENLKRMFRGKFLPHASTLVLRQQERDKTVLLAPYAVDYPMKERKSTYYFCRNHACSAPVVTLAELDHMLS